MKTYTEFVKMMAQIEQAYTHVWKRPASQYTILMPMAYTSNENMVHIMK